MSNNKYLGSFHGVYPIHEIAPSERIIITMKLNRQNLLKIVIGSLLISLLLPFLLAATILDVYDCAGKNLIVEACDGLESADWKISIGVALQVLSWGVFVASLAIYLWMLIVNKK